MVFGIILKILGFPATLLCRLFNVPFAGSVAAILVTLVYIFAYLMITWLINKYMIIYPEKFPWYISKPYLFFKGIFGKKDGFISPPLEYKKQLNNDGGIGWVPYYGKPGRSCEGDQDCPTFQKCEEDKCVIPPGVR